MITYVVHYNKCYGIMITGQQLFLEAKSPWATEIHVHARLLAI